MPSECPHRPLWRAGSALRTASVLFSHSGAVPVPLQGIRRVLSKGAWWHFRDPARACYGCHRNVILWALGGARHLLPNQYLLPSAQSAELPHPWRDWQLLWKRRSLNMCLCFCCRLLQVNGWQVEAEEGQST